MPILDVLFALKVSVVDELGIPVKFVGVGEGAEDLQPFDAEAFVNAIFPWRKYTYIHICVYIHLRANELKLL